MSLSTPDAFSSYRKRRYATEADAIRVIRMRQMDGAEATLRVYPCYQCGGFHLTSQPKRAKCVA